MIQKNYLMTCYDELKQKIPELIKEVEGIDYNCGVIDVFVGDIPKKDIMASLALLKETFPKLVISGMTTGSFNFLNNTQSSLFLGFTFIQKASVNLFCKEIGIDSKTVLSDSLAYANFLREEIKRIPDVKCVELFFAQLKASASNFIYEFSKGLEDIPIYGSMASANGAHNMVDYVAVNYDDSAVFGDSWTGPGVSAIVYSGKDLYVYEEYLFGWTPVGRYMDIVSCDMASQGKTTVLSIDNQKPIDIYDKYLGVKPNNYFVTNVCEFPLVVERNGVLIGRTPSAYGDNGEIYLEGDILPEEKVRFSYGERDDILNDTINAANRMNAFGAERLSLVICSNRFNFLQEDYHLEIDYYTDICGKAPEVILGMGEIYRYKDQGGILNSALVAVGMREGLGDVLSSPILHSTVRHEHDQVVPLAERLSRFLKTMTGELLEAVDNAKAASEAKSSFLSNMSHEIRTPINAVLGMDEMILRECEDQQITEYAHNIKTAGNSLLGLVNDILDFSKIEAGKLDIIPVDYDISSIINDLVHMIKPRAEAKNLELKIDIDPNLPSVLNGDEIRIKQIITNILTNAVKYTERGYIELKCGFEKISDDKIVLKVSVKDTGIGIREEDLGKLFTAFQRIEEQRNRNIEGTGLGLNITGKLLHLMDSELKVSSEYGKGSNFFFDLEQKVVKWNPVGDYMEAYEKALLTRTAYKEKFTAPDANVLVVDDTPMNITVFAGLLKKTLVNIDTAESGQECLEKTRLKKYDMIFLDHRMPGMDGIETLQKLKSEKDNPNRGTITISLTANAVSGARAQYIEAGFDDYLTKPIMADKLEGIMIQFLPKEKLIVTRSTPAEDEEFALDNTTPLPDWLGSLSMLNTKEGIANCGGTKLYTDTVISFADSAVDNYNAIEQFLKNQAIADYTIKVHALKSSARIIGAIELSKLAEDLESAGLDNDLVLINKKTPLLLAMYKDLFEAIVKKRGLTEDAKKLPPIEPEQLTEALNTIKELASSFDYDSIKYILDSINGYSFPADKHEMMESLKKAISNADWDEIKKVLDLT